MKVKVIVFEPLELSKVVDVDFNDFKAIHDIVDGYIEVVSINEHLVALVDEDGLQKHKTYCRTICREYRSTNQMKDIVGTFAIASIVGGEFVDVSESDIAKYQKMIDADLVEYIRQCEEFDKQLIEDLML